MSFLRASLNNPGGTTRFSEWRLLYRQPCPTLPSNTWVTTYTSVLSDGLPGVFIQVGPFQHTYTSNIMWNMTFVTTTVQLFNNVQNEGGDLWEMSVGNNRLRYGGHANNASTDPFRVRILTGTGNTVGNRVQLWTNGWTHTATSASDGPWVSIYTVSFVND